MKATSHLFLSSVNKSYLDRALGREKRRTGRKKADGTCLGYLFWFPNFYRKVFTTNQNKEVVSGKPIKCSKCCKDLCDLQQSSLMRKIHLTVSYKHSFKS